MTLDLIKTTEPDGKWFKIIGVGGWPLKVISFNDENEAKKRIEALNAFTEFEIRAKEMNITVLKSIEI